MIYINGQAVAPTYNINPVNLLDNYTVQAGGFNYSWGNDYTVVSKNNTYCFGLITVEAGKLYELYAPKTVRFGVLQIDDDNKYRFDSGWQTENVFYIVPNTHKLAIVFEVVNGEYEQYADEFVLCESELYTAEKVNISFASADWTHYGIAYSNGRSFTDAKNAGSSSQFRYENLIPIEKYPYLMVNSTGLTVAIQQYDENELGRVDSGWLSSYKQAPVWYDNIAISGNSNISIDTIIERMQTGLSVYLIKRRD